MSKIKVFSKCDCCKKDFKYKDGQIQLCTNCKRKSKRLAYRISAANYKNNVCEICGLKRNTIDDLENKSSILDMQKAQGFIMVEALDREYKRANIKIENLNLQLEDKDKEIKFLHRKINLKFE